MASNASKLWDKVKTVTDKATTFASKHPVASTAASISSLNPVIMGVNIAGQFKDTSKSKSGTNNNLTYDTQALQGYNADELYKLYGGGSGSGGGGGYDVAKADISGLLESYNKQADAARQAAETKYANTRSDLLTSLKRFQEQNAADVKNQKQNYLAQQANLEGAREQANRQNRISASARGLGGSGLQQLAQLQNLLGQGEEISKAAGANQTAMDKLANLLREYQEDSDTKLKQNEEERANTLNNIAATLANQSASAIANNEQAYTNALNQARAQAAAARASASSNNAAARREANAAAGALTLLQNNLSDKLSSLNGMSKSELKKFMADNYGQKNVTDLNKAKQIIRQDYNDSLLGIQDYYRFGANTAQTAQNNLNILLNNLQYGNNNPWRIGAGGGAR